MISFARQVRRLIQQSLNSYMDFDHFVRLCGRSLFAEEYRGDFDAAGDYLQQTRPDTSKVEPVVYAEYLRCSAIYSVLIGRPGDAYESLELLKGLLDQLPKEWGLRYSNYKVLTDYTRRYPPLLHFYHEAGRPINIPMLGDISGLAEMTESFMGNCNKYFAGGLPGDQALAFAMNGVIGFNMALRNLTAHFHPRSPTGRVNTAKEDILPEVVKHSQRYVGFRDTADLKGAFGMGTYMFRLVVEMHLASQSAQSVTCLQELCERCERLGDLVGLANAKLLEADSLISPPFASPITLNLAIVDITNATQSDALWDPVEADLGYEWGPRAWELYESALELFREAKSKRGQAAVLLRQACCLHNKARHERLKEKQMLELLAESEIKLQEALILSGKDEVSSQLVKAHLILTGITRGTPGNVKAIARSIGVWGVDAKNETTAHFIGMIFCRYAHNEWTKFSNMDSALLAWECGYEVCEPLEDIIPMFQSVVSRAFIHDDMFNPVASLIYMDEAMAMVDPLAEYLESKIRSAPDTPLGQMERTNLMISKFTMLSTFDSGVKNVYFQSEDLQKYNEWHAKLAYRRENDESFKFLREKLEAGEVKQLVHPNFSFPIDKVKGLWQRTLADDACTVRYTSANLTFRRLMEQGDILKAEASFRRYVEETADLEGGYSGALYRILACERIGDQVKAREILDSIDDNGLFNERLDAFEQGIGIRTIFYTTAVNALVFPVFAGDMERARRVVNLIIKICPAFFEQASESANDHSKCLSYYAQIMKDEEPEICFGKLLEARRIIETRRIQTNDPDARIGSASQGWVAEVFMNLARLCLRWETAGVPVSFISAYEHGHFDDISWSEHALLFIEMSRARAVLESLQAQAKQAPGMTGVTNTAPISEAVHKRRVLRSLLVLKELSLEQKQEVSQLKKDIEDLEQDGNLSYATSFIETVNSTIEPRLLYQSIGEDAVVIEANFAPRGYMSFAVTKEGIQKVHQGTTTVIDIRRPVMQVMHIMRNMTGYIGEEEDARRKDLDKLSQEISSVLLAPFAETIRTKSHVIFSVSDPMTAFPFASLIFDGKPLVMHAAVSQVPSLTVLHHLCQRKSASITPTVSVLAKSPTEEPSDNATPSTKEVNLHMAGIEAVNIARMFATWPIEASRVTREGFREYLKGGSMVMHIGTHGVLNYRNPLLSSISIGDGQDFRVIDMSTVRSSVHLLVFAACLSGLGKATFSSEVLGFSHVVLSSGCRAYIGSLWKVSDFGSMLVMTFFYRHLKSMPHLSVAELMRQAQLDVMRLDGEKAGLLLDELVHDWATKGVEDHSPAEFVPDAEFLLSVLKMIIDQLDWSSPFYWAPFTLVGYGGFRFVLDVSSEMSRLHL